MAAPARATSRQGKMAHTLFRAPGHIDEQQKGGISVAALTVTRLKLVMAAPCPNWPGDGRARIHPDLYFAQRRRCGRARADRRLPLARPKLA